MEPTCTPSSTPQSASAPYRFCPLLSHFEMSTAGHIQTCRGSAQFALKIAHSCLGLWTLSNAWFLGPTSPHPNGILISSAVLQGSRSLQTERQTDHATPSITIGCIYLVQQCDLIITNNTKQNWHWGLTRYPPRGSGCPIAASNPADTSTNSGRKSFAIGNTTVLYRYTYSYIPQSIQQSLKQILL